MKNLNNNTIIISVFGGRETRDEEYTLAEELGKEIAKNNWVLLCGGRMGVMEAVSKGCSEAGGTVIGILPGIDSSDANPYVQIPIATGIGLARNEIVACACHVAVAVGGRYGTLSEIGHALQYGKPVVSLRSWDIEGVMKADDVPATIKYIKEKLNEG
ncbi:MAG: TIGR00725 family protein [Candidatus Neomarinimicrobiota bacterium]|jgi:uncharacterized protein (TIGR00725 family)